jgi:hypothetical protein
MLAPSAIKSDSHSADLTADFSAFLARAPSAKRASMLLSLVDLFAAVADRIGDPAIDVFDALFLAQLSITDHDTLVAVSTRLSALPNAPPKLIRALADNDSVDIAGPVLARSQRLDASDLARCAATQGQDHLHALCHRTEIPEVLSAALIKHGGRSVIDRLAQTDGVRYLASDFALLLQSTTLDERNRAKVRLPVLVETANGQPAVAATALNISPRGSYLMLDGNANLPAFFALVFPSIEGRRTLCCTAWKTVAGLGVSFETNPFAPA